MSSKPLSKIISPRILLGSICMFGGVVLLSAQDPAKEQPPTIVPTSLFSVPDDLEVTVWATTPLLHNPTNIDFDRFGRLFVAEGVNYRSKAGRRPEGDRIVVLEDTTGAGKADKSSVFVQEAGLTSPLGVAVLDDKVVVSQPPDLLVYTDVNGDAKFDPAVDKREVLLTGFNGRNHDHSLHSLTAGPDGLWYFNQGNTGGQFTDKSGKTFYLGSPYVEQTGTPPTDPRSIAGKRSDDGHIWIGAATIRMNPDGTHAQIVGHNYRNSYEQTVNSFGQMYQSDNDDPPACRVTPILEGGNAGFASRDGKRTWSADKRPGQEIPTAEWRQEDPGTMPAGDVYGGGSPTGVAFYENGALGDKYRGLLMACEAGKNVVFGYYPKSEGAGFKMERFDFLTSNKAKNFAGSDFLGSGGNPNHTTETLFRPSDVVVGPDGAIYVADWFDARVGGHGTLDDQLVGTIYRIAPKGFVSKVPKLDLSTTEGQIGALKNPAVHVRYSGFIRLKAQGEKAVPAVSEVLNDANPYVAARAIWLLAQMGPAGEAKVRELQSSKDENVRLVAFRALLRAGKDPVEIAAAAAKDSSAAVRAAAAISLRDVPFAKSGVILQEIAKGYDGKDATYLEALGLGSEGKEADLYTALRPAQSKSAEDWTSAFARIAWRLGTPASVVDLRARALSAKLSAEERKLMVTAIAFVKDPAAVEAMADVMADKGSPVEEDAKWWLANRRSNEWQMYPIDVELQKRGIALPKPAGLVSVMTPELPTTPSTLPTVKDIVALKGDVERGQAAVGVCYSCHKIGSVGAEFAPDLTAFGKIQPREVLVNAIVNPSAEISHGFEGTRVEAGVKKGDKWTVQHTIDGILVSDGDPLVIKSVGGLVQKVERAKAVSVTKMTRSLMPQPEMLGLDAQKISDIVTYLQSDKIK
ncbi:MAG: PVC-type heme-binding CxxCH protein [Verrucomicrobiota bacterium]